MLNSVVFEQLLIVDGTIREVRYTPPFDLVLHGRVARQPTHPRGGCHGRGRGCPCG
jgi:hypothetical protein